MTDSNRALYESLISGKEPEYRKKDKREEYFKTHRPQFEKSSENTISKSSSFSSSSLPVSKEQYESQKEKLKDEKKEAWKDHLWNMAKDVATSTYSIVNTNDKTRALAKASDEARKQSKKVKDSYSKKIADLDIARNEYNIAEATEQLKDEQFKSRVGELYRNKLAMEGQSSVGNQQAAQQATSMYGQKYKELKDEGYDVEQLLDVYGRQANEKTAEKMKSATEEFVKDSPGKAVLANAGSVLFNAVSGSGMLGAIESKIKELISGEPQPIDTNSKYFAAGNIRDTIRSTTDGEIQKNIDNETLKGIASFAYQTGMSVGDFLSVSWMPQPVSLAIMAGSAGTSATKQVVENGGTTSQALLTGLAAGGAEVLFEKLSLDNFKALQAGEKGFKAFANGVLKQSLTEGSEELFTDIANRVSDDLINGGLSQYNLSVEQYKAQGLSDQEAKDQADKDYVKQLATSFAGGALSGGVIGSVGSSIGNARYNSYAKNVGKNIQSTNNVQATVDKGLSVDTNSKLYQMATEMASKMKKGEKLSPYSIGNLHNEISSTNFDKNIMSAVQGRLAQLHANDENNNISEAIVKRLSREKVSMTDNGIIQNSTQAKRVISEYENNYNNQFSNDWARRVTENEYVPQSTETSIASAQQNVPQEAVKSNFSLTDTNSNVVEKSQSNKLAPTVSTKPSKVRLIDGGEEVEIKEITKNSNGKAVLKTSNNKTTELEQVKFSSPEAEQVYKTAMQMPSKGTADKFIRSYNANKEDGGTANLERFNDAFKILYKKGVNGEDYKSAIKTGYISNGSLSLLSASQAFFAGQDEVNRANSVIIGSKKYDIGVANLSKRPLSQLQKTQIENLNKISKSTGVSVVVADGLADGNDFADSYGAYKDGTIYINSYKVGDGINYVAGHELVHFIKEKSADGYRELEKVVVSALKGNENYDLDEEIQKKINQYWKAGQQLTRAEAIEEIVAESCFDVLSNKKTVSKIAKQDKNLAHRIKNWLENFIAKLKEVAESIGKDRAEYKALHNNVEALEAINQAFHEALVGIKNTDTNSDGEAKYMLVGKETDGTEVYETSEETKKAPFSARKSKLLENIREEFKGRTVKFNKNGTSYYATLNQSSAKKGVYGDKKSDTKGYKAKINIGADGNYFELAENSRYSNSKDEKGKTTNTNIHKNVQTWDYFVKTIKSDGKYFDVLINVADKGNDKYVYDIALNEKKETTPLSSSKITTLNQETVVSNTNISQSENGVNSHSMQETKKDTKFMLPTTDSDDSDIQLYRNQQFINENKALKKQMGILEKRIELLKKEFTLTKKHEKNGKLLDVFARRTLKKYESDYDLETFKGELSELFGYISNSKDVDYDNIVYQGSRIAKNMLEKSSTLDKELWNESKSFREYLKSTKISLSEAQKKEVANYYGSYDSFRKSLFGSVTFTNDGITLDELWSEISNRPDFGYYFDGETHELDQPMKLKEFFEMVKPTYKGGFEMDMNTSALSVALEIYDAYFEIPESVTFADKKRQELLSLRKQYRDEMLKWKSEYRDRYKKELLQTKIDLKKKATISKSEALLKQKVHHEIVRHNAKERRDNTVVRHKILNVHKRLTTMLTQNTETKHVPVELIKSVVDVLETLNMNTMEDSTSKEELYIKYAKATSKKERAEIQDKIDRLAKREDNLEIRLIKASNLYSELKESDSYTLQNVYDETIGEDIAELKRVIGNTPINKLSTSQMEKTYDVFKSVEHTVRTANKAFKDEKGETIEKMGRQVLIELSDMKRPGAKLSVANKLDEQGWALLTSVYAMRHIGSKTLISAYSKIREGQNVWALDLDEARGFAQSQYNSLYTDKKALKKSHIVNLISGEAIGITTNEAMSIYAYSRREQGVKHLLGGGFQFSHNVSKETIETDSKLKQVVNKHLYTFETSPSKLTIEDINAISNLLTDEQKRYARKMQDYLSDVMGEKGNEVTMAMYGIRKFDEKHYFPLKSSKDFLAVKNENPQDSKLKKRSFTNKTIQNANNPIVLEGFTDVWARHCNEMAMYHGFALPIEDFTRVYNFKTRVTEDSSGQSVINGLNSLYGKGANNYINHFLADINGNARSDPDTSIPAKALTTFKKGATFLSASVGIQQASAIGRALYLIDPKYFVKVSADETSIFKPKTWAEIKKYAPVAIIKDMGHFDMNMGRSTTDWIMQPEYSLKEKPGALIKDSNYRDDLLSKFPSKSDEVAWCAIWNAVQLEVQDKQNLKIGTEENKLASGKRFSEVIDMTQVYDSTLSRSQLMRNKNVYISMATSFMSEPTVSLNMLTDGLYQAKRNGKEGKKLFARAVGAWLFSELLNALLKSIITAGRDDDEYDKYREKYVRHFFDNLSSGLFIPNLVPYVKDIVSVFQGYDIERADMTVVQDAYNAVRKICDGEITWGEKVLEVAKTASVFFGVPIKNAIRDVKMFGNIATGWKLDKELNSIDYKYAMKEGLLAGFTGRKHTPTGHFKRLYEAKRNGDTEKYDEIYYILKQSGKSDKKILSGLRASMAENDERIIEAAKKKDKGDFVGYAKITQEIRAGGFEYNDVAKAVNSALTKLRKDEVEEEDDNEQRVSLYSYDDLNGAIENGDSGAVNLIVQEKVETKLANGGTEKDAKKAIKSQLTSYWKPEYISSGGDGRAEIRKKLLNTGVYDKTSDLDDLLKRWRKEEE